MWVFLCALVWRERGQLSRGESVEGLRESWLNVNRLEWCPWERGGGLYTFSCPPEVAHALGKSATDANYLIPSACAESEIDRVGCCSKARMHHARGSHKTFSLGRLYAERCVNTQHRALNSAHKMRPTSTFPTQPMERPAEIGA